MGAVEETLEAFRRFDSENNYEGMLSLNADIQLTSLYPFQNNLPSPATGRDLSVDHTNLVKAVAIDIGKNFCVLYN